ncbi:hypothetical protein BCR44DRAFT_1436390 [Catenaria anguillulae PL171]|uniref:Uncharacterized protein n=1 Tax=Catenaria anguillulae PL171 TaxID=765915 RepID=A0A1Y2HKB7_9FUNG|nr:hypothetical protein BCR44DRAFT_1436390 [Catenaria anguillulae PL171]
MHLDQSTRRTSMALPLDIAEQVLIAAIRTNISVRSLNADFPAISDAALQHMVWISLDSIAQAGDTWLLGRLLDATVSKPNPPIRTLRSSPHVLARASEAGHLDFLGYWLRLVRRFDVVPLTLTMVRRAISAAVRAEQLHVLEWWLSAIPKLFLQYELEQCWAAAYEAAESILVLDRIKKLRMTDSDGNVNRPLVQRMLDDNVRDDYWSFERAVVRAHGAGNLAVMQWWFSQVPHLDKVRFLLPRMLTWDKRYVASNLYFFWANDLSQRTGPCLTLCWRQYERSRLIFADLDAWKANAPDLLKRALDQALCWRCRDIIQNSSPSTCPVRECAQDHRIDCTIPPEGLFRDRKFHKQHLSMALCKEGLVAGFRALLHSGRNAFAYVHSHAFLVASKRGHFGILRVWLEECQDDDFRAYPLWDGHDVDGKWLRWMSLDEFGGRSLLRFSYRALQFKSYESGVKSLRCLTWWKCWLLGACPFAFSRYYHRGLRLGRNVQSKIKP